jgi:glycosyltransferase involved in cell wall biosynthesis
MSDLAANPERPLVSVVMIFFQAERFIAEAIESVIAQTHPGWELLLVDDGATDGSAAIAQRYAARDPHRIRCLRHPDGGNHGMAASRNLGMRAAKGEVLAFLDADDVWMPHRLERHLELLARRPRPAVAISSDLYWYSWAEGVPGLRPAERDRIVTIGVADGAVFDPPDLLELMVRPRLAASPGICSLSFHRGADGATPEVPAAFVATFEDQCLVALLLAERAAVVSDEPLAKYRQHPWSSTARARSAGTIAADGTDPMEKEFLAWLREHLVRRRLMTAALERALAERGPWHGEVGAAWSTLRVLERSLLRLAGAVLPRGAALSLRAASHRLRDRLRRRRVSRVERPRC